MSQRDFHQLNFSGGLNLAQDATAIPEGQLSVLENWVPEGTGILRPRTRWVRPGINWSGFPTGITGIHWMKTGSNLVFFSNGVYGTNTTTIYKSTGGSVPSVLDTVTVDTGQAQRIVHFANDDTVTLYGNQAFPNDRLRWTDGTSTGEASTAAVAGDGGLVYYLNRFWSAKGTVLYYSGIDDYTDWNSSNYIEIAPWNSTQITDVQVALDGLLISKVTGLYYLSGTTFADFKVNSLEVGEGTYGKCICVTPYGVVILGSGNIWLWQGGVPVDISENLMGAETIYSFTNGGAWPGAQLAFLGDDLFVKTVGSTEEVDSRPVFYVRNMRTGTWRKETTESASYVVTGDPNNSIGMLYDDVATGNFTTMIGAPFGGGIGPGGTYLPDEKGYWYRSAYPYMVDEYNDYTRTFDALLDRQRFRAETGAIPLGGGVGPATVRNLHLTLGQRETTPGEKGLKVSLINDETGEQQDRYIPTTTEALRRERLDFGMTGYFFRVAFDHDPDSTDTVTFDILSAIIELDWEKPR